MESVGKFEFSRKDLIGHGAFAVVFKGRHKQKHDFEVAVKCINKKNLAKSQSLLGKEIRILKVSFVEISGCVYLVMEVSQDAKGSLSEDTIRVLLQQLAGAMSVLRSKGIVHRDLKPQNILLSYSTGHKSNPNNFCIKLADFGFARYLQGNTMAATLCGSPMYMAPEVIMSQNYDVKADLWSVGTIIYQCLTGKAPFQVFSFLSLFFHIPRIPRETSSHLRHLLLGLLQRNHGERMDFDEFFHHPFLEASTSMKKSSPVPMPPYPSSASGSSSSGSSTSRRCLHAVWTLITPSLSLFLSRPLESCASSYAQSMPVPVPTQKHNYQRMEQNLQVSDRTEAPVQHCCSNWVPTCGRIRASSESGGSRPYLPSPQVGNVPETPNQPEPVGSRTGLFLVLTFQLSLRCMSLFPRAVFMGRLCCCRSLSTGRLSDKLLKAVFGHQFDTGSCESLNSEKPMDTTAPPGVSDGSGSPAGVVFMLGSPEYGHTPPHATRPRLGTPSPTSPGWIYGHLHEAYSSPDSLRYGYTDAMAKNLCEGVAFVPPELPEETLMEEGHTDLLSQLRFILAFAHCITEVAGTKDSGIERNMALDASFLEQSVVADQISLLSREWSSAEQLVLYMKCAELLSSALHTAMAGIKEGKLYPSGSVKQVVRKLNEMYKKSVNSCRSLTEKLQLFFSSKQRLMDRINSITAERLIYTHTIQMVQTAALDEMFHHGETCVERYHKALLLMEGLSLIITETADLNNINKCKQCIERRLSSLQPKGCV
uniref:non-specific serine/threonine protein kinase n=1 Tax=Cyprinus carpio carpio TaxID=630221 RepID=A0A8C1BUK1_CYPCA